MKLEPYQQSAVDFAAPRETAAILMAPRTGKTLVTLEILKRWEIESALVVVPVIGIPVWKAECQKWSSAVKLEIISYARLGKHIKSYLRHPPECLILDESQRIKNRGSLQSRAAKRLRKKVVRRLLLTGTLIGKGYVDTYAQMDFVSPGLLGNRFTDFRGKYCRMGGWKGKKIIGYKNQEQLRRLVSSVSFMQESDVVIKSPETDRHHRLLLGRKAEELYQRIEDGLIEMPEFSIQNALTILMALRQLCGGFHLGKLVYERKLKKLLEIISPPAIVFAQFIQELKAIQNYLPHRVGIISGRTKNRHEIREAFQSGKLDIVAIQIQSGLSIDLSAANQAIFYSLDWSYSDHRQNRDRIKAIYKQKNLVYDYVVVRNSVDQVILDAVKSRKSMAKALYEYYRLKKSQAVS